MFRLSYFFGKYQLEGNNTTQNYLILQPAYKYFKTLTHNDRGMTWKSKRFSNESIKPRATSDNSFNTRL